MFHVVSVIYIFISYDVCKNTKVKPHEQLYVLFFILSSVSRMACCPHADQILSKLSAPHKGLSRPAPDGN